ncbi:uncharacterized protein A4U43_C10F5240 [Asparagus officinalis]|uniref:Uncharacterized protein n=1 Tax=Asparagus officinalis TaxID=4686 RepID=A0A5P1E141_ASPOF|nr:uncharacterized protein A4U43_C10F5240 [Asparagus officinalis]
MGWRHWRAGVGRCPVVGRACWRTRRLIVAWPRPRVEGRVCGVGFGWRLWMAVGRTSNVSGGGGQRGGAFGQHQRRARRRGFGRCLGQRWGRAMKGQTGGHGGKGAGNSRAMDLEFCIGTATWAGA